jgi:hypothetical protein
MSGLSTGPGRVHAGSERRRPGLISRRSSRSARPTASARRADVKTCL